MDRQAKLKLMYGLAAAVSVGNASAKEVETGADGTRDWNRIERLRYVENSLKETGPGLVALLPKIGPTFVAAANSNTQATRVGEYATVAQRNAYYDLISLVIEFEPTTAAQVKPVRFFHATTIVTLRSMLGFPDSFKDSGFEEVAKDFGACFAGASATRDFIERVNIRLFAVNMPVINNLLFKWKRPQHPTSGDAAEIDAYLFDLAMVDLEQTTVEEEIKVARPTKALFDEVNKLFSCPDSGAFLGPILSRYSPLGEAKKWADKARGGVFDFSVKHHRVLLGKALVTVLHKKTEVDFRKAVGL